MTDEPARYLAMARLVLEPDARTIEAGEPFEFADEPHAGMLPLNSTARRAKLRFLDAHWRETRPQQIQRLARSLGWSKGTDAEAEAHIEKFIAETERENAP